MPKEVQKERREAAANATLSKKETERNTNAEKSRMKGKNRVSKRYRKKQQNVVDDKKMRANILKEEQKKKAKRLADGSGDGPEGGGGYAGQNRRGRIRRTSRARRDIRSAEKVL